MVTPRVIIKPRRRSFRIDFAELIRYKDLLYFMVLRDVTVLYKQSVLGIAWAFITPIFSMIVFSIVFGRLANVPSDGIPYPLFAYAGLIPWTYFSNALNASGSSLVSSSAIFTKVYFPRIFIPLTPIISKLLDLFVSLVFLAGLLVYYNSFPGLRLLLFPVLVLLLIITTAGLGMWLSALAIQYRDVKFAITFITPLLMYAAPVVFPASLVLNKFGSSAYLVYGLYPLTGIIEGFRAMIAPDRSIDWHLLGMSSVGALLILIVGTIVFKKMESRFADVA